MEPTEGLPAVNIRISGQALRYLENCDDSEFHLLRGEIILISANPQVDGSNIIALQPPMDVFRIHQGEQYAITFHMSNPNTMLVIHIQTRQS